MATQKHAAYAESATSILTTELNSLANNTISTASSAIDNSSDCHLFMDVELYVHTQGSNRSAGATVALLMLHTLDGTNYDDAHIDTAEVCAVFTFDATATTARRRTIRDIPIPPGLFKLAVRNQTGQTFASGSNTVKYRRHSLSSA